MNLPITKNPRYGWIPDLPDHRDRIFVPALGVRDPATLPRISDLATKVPIVDQGMLGSCTGNGLASAHYYDQLICATDDGKCAVPFQPSRLFIYYNERFLENSIPYDAGAYIRDGIKSMRKWGVCREEGREAAWPYNINKFTKRPPDQCYHAALKHQIVRYQRIPRNMNSIRMCLAGNRPFVFGFTVYESFESEAVSKTGIVPLPLRHEGVLGGHCTMAVGYNDDTRLVKAQNSWGAAWGDKGYFYLPYEFFTDPGLSDDFWTIQTVE